ncbi:LysR family transcriptional regulator [Nitratireductor sp. ZSWI3]|uniref:LysR family transcriptional regulator n=1 Tax=Nitratireductor sp. ZSWI3 TaxID=2966359 RepID=UPI00214F8A44|nr:LysR family transcriptional regulator [Nitratireductor sp. ZSWI3]MCR4268839.1 LysR family transcriptional regulator [Nitratireductor sp. ZSWI3]
MDSRLLETFLAVARGGSLTAAARQLDITPTAVAQRMRALEAEFGVPLVIRAGRRVRPTEAGNAVLSRAEAALGELRAMRDAILSRDISGELRIGAISTALTGLLPAVLERLAADHPGLRIFLEPGASSQLYERTVSGQLDAAAIVRPGFMWPKSVTFTTWSRERLILLVPESERRGDVLEILRDRPIIVYDRSQWGGRLAASWLSANGIDSEPRFELDALDAIAVLVDRGLGVSVVPEWQGPRPESLRLRSLPLPPPATHREIGIIHPLSGPRVHLLRVLLQCAGLAAPRGAL